MPPLNNFKIVFFGTPSFAAEVLKTLLKHNVDIRAVVTKPDRPKGRSAEPLPPAVKVLALSQKPPIPVFQPELASDPQFFETLKTLEADLFVVVAYGEIIKQHLLDLPKSGCINLHASLLPKLRGAAPIQRAIMHGEKETGVTVMHMVRKMDAGNIIRTAKVPIEQNETFADLERKLCDLGKELLYNTILDLQQNTASEMPQDHSQATYAPKVESEECEVHWSRSPFELHNLVRGVYEHPGAWCFVNHRGKKKRLKIFSTRYLPDIEGACGEIIRYDQEGIIVACSEGGLQLLEVQLEGKERMSAQNFIRGVPQESLSFF